jgi:peptidoglycan-associated lipoprotein
MKLRLLTFGLSAFLAACGSSVKLDTVPVEDKTGMPISSQQNAANNPPRTDMGQVTQSGVTPLTIGQPNAAAANPAGPRLVYFDYDSYVIKPEFQSVIEAQARYMKGNKNLKVAIEGHTDERGGREYNLSLGQRRAEAVRQAMGLLGVSDAQLEAVSFGKEKPAEAGSDESAMAKNRRAEIMYR